MKFEKLSRYAAPSLAILALAGCGEPAATEPITAPGGTLDMGEHNVSLGRDWYRARSMEIPTNMVSQVNCGSIGGNAVRRQARLVIDGQSQVDCVLVQEEMVYSEEDADRYLALPIGTTQTSK